MALALTLSGCSDGETSADLESFRPGPGDNDITITYIQGPSDSPGHIEIIEEGSTQIRIRVLYEAADGVQPDLGIAKEAVGRLKQPVGGRSVVDERGNEVPQVESAE
ncbi:hypothetical protein [Actinoplanes aureus]|uniref:Uncharacterized protein n=1 Tax=Actinoplanes aureus TaxID=2792083 RepID=A0A931G3W2_9ACTN|nr:hypothetical protein [Actinoplanes aureus]MBG0569307.1 hypothetical protein [Actinoplanes aureus]